MTSPLEQGRDELFEKLMKTVKEATIKLRGHGENPHEGTAYIEDVLLEVLATFGVAVIAGHAEHADTRELASIIVETRAKEMGRALRKRVMEVFEEHREEITSERLVN